MIYPFLIKDRMVFRTLPSIKNLTMKKTLFLGLFLASLLQAQAQNWTWAETAGGTLPDEANGCAIDESGNMYASGFYFSNSINFGNGNSLSNDGICDGFVVKYNNAGSTQWASKVKGSSEDKTTKCDVDNAGNVVATGYFNSNSIQFGGNNSHTVSNSNNGSFDGFIVKYNSNGTPLWFHAIGAADDDGGADVATDAAGNVYVTGWWRAASMTVGPTVLTSYGDSDMFLIKYDPNGNVLWAKTAGGADDDKGRGVTVDLDGNVIVTGYFKADMTIGNTVYPNSGGKDPFVIKYDPNGNVLHAKVFGNTGSEEAFSCSTDGDGSVYVTGNFTSSTVSFDTQSITNTGSSSGIFLVKLDSTLTAVWARAASSNNKDEPRDCSTNIHGNTVVTGIFSGSNITFGNTVLNNNGDEEIFIAKYDKDGNLFWAKKIGKSKSDGGNGIAINNNGKIAIAGYYNSGSLTLGNFNLNNSYFGIATSDVFVASMCPTSIGADVQTACDSYTWTDGNTYTANNNTAVVNFPAGATNTCDSMVVLNLTINSVDVNVTETAPTLTANATGAIYRWLDCTDNYTFLTGENGRSFTATNSGSYAVEVTQNGCTDTSACQVLTTVGISEPSSSIEVSLFPNPAASQVTVQLYGSFEKIRVDIFDQLGRVVFSKTDKGDMLNFNVNSFESGVYFIQIQTTQFKATKKLTVQRF